MRRIRETLRLHLQAGLSFSDIGRALKLSKSVVGKYVSLARAAGVDWALAQTLSDAELEARLYRPAMPTCCYGAGRVPFGIPKQVSSEPMPVERRQGGLWPEPLAHRVAEDAGAEQIAEVIVAVWQEIDQALHPIIGHRGVAALFNRSLHLTAATYPWLAIGHQGAAAAVDPSALRAALARREAAEAAAAGIALLQQFRELLASLVGASLTDRLLRSVWAPPPGASSAQDTTS